MAPRPETEREWWDLLTTQTPESMRWKARFDADYQAIREYVAERGGMRGVLRPVAEAALADGIPDGYFDALREVHPRALALLASHGTEFGGLGWHSPLPGEEPKSRVCFGNAAFFTYLHNRIEKETGGAVRARYVEGVAFGVRTEAVLHAWNRIGPSSSDAIDWSWYAVTGWTFYLGIPFTEEQHTALREEAYSQNSFHLLFRKGVFEKIEERVRKIIEDGG